LRSRSGRFWIGRRGEADAEPFDFSGPAFPLGFRDAVEEVAVDLHEPTALCRVGPEEGAADAGFSELLKLVGFWTGWISLKR
jgi:hypothetical protein